MDIVERIKRDLDSVSKELEELERKMTAIGLKRSQLASEKATLQKAYDLYARKDQKGGPLAQEPTRQVLDLGSLTIAEASVQVLRDNDNRWMATREIQQALQGHNKSVHYNALDMTLKAKDKTFEIRKDPTKNRNQFRLKVGG